MSKRQRQRRAKRQRARAISRAGKRATEPRGGVVGDVFGNKRFKDRSALGKAASFLPPVAIARGVGSLFGGNKAKREERKARRARRRARRRGRG